MLFWTFTSQSAWSFPFFQTPKPPFRIMLSPAGDAQNTGRVVGNSFERAITYTIAQAVKAEIESLFKDSKVLISRHPGQVISQNTIASYTNRADIDLFIHICTYQDESTKPYLSLYRFSYGDEFITTHPETDLIGCTQGYLKTNATTKMYANTVYKSLTAHNQQNFQIRGPYAFPYKPLLGIIVPALSFEIGLTDSQAVQPAIQALVNSIAGIIKERVS